MDIQQLIAGARQGKWAPVHVLAGPERFLIERAVSLLKSAVMGDGPAGFNDDLFHGQKSLSAQAILSAARTLPMMAAARFVLVRGVDLMAAAEHDGLLEYLDDPSPSTCLVLVLSNKPDGRSKLVKRVKKKKVFTEAKELKGGAIRGFIEAEAEGRGHRLDRTAAAALADAIGADLSAIDDALERLSLYVGAGNPIPLGAVEACVTRVRTETIWALVDAVSARDKRKAVGAVGSLLADREPPLRILAMLARQLRSVARMRGALAAGLRGQEATAKAGAPPFKARELTEAARRFDVGDLRDAFRTLAEADLALKGSKRPGPLVLEEAVVRLCTREIRMRVPPPPKPRRSP